MKTFRLYMRLLLEFSGGRALLELFLLTFLGLIEGIGILMIIPMLDIVLRAGKTGSAGGVGIWVRDFLGGMGLPMTLPVILTAYIGLVTMQSLLKRFQAVHNAQIIQGFRRRLSDRLYASLSHADWLFIIRNKSSDITYVLTSEIQRIATGTHFFLIFISTAVIAVVQMGLACILSFPMTMIALGCGFALMLLQRPQNRISSDTGKRLLVHRQGMYSAVMEHLSGIKIAKSFGAEHRHLAQLKDLNGEIETQNVAFAKARADMGLMYEVGFVVAISILFYVAVEGLAMPPTELLLLVYIFARLLPKISTLHQHYQNIVNMLPSFDALTDLQTRSDMAVERYPESPPAPMGLQKGVFFEDVSFRYVHSDSKWILNRIHLALPAHAMTAIVGSSGAGKSTLADLMMGLLRPESGVIRIDDAVLDESMIHAWRGCIGYVPQETFLFHDTIRANLKWANPDASEEELTQVLKLAAADRFVEKLPDGMDTVVGDRGVRLSGGERQRIALARALLRHPALLLLDEATSSLDRENERSIQQAIENLHGELTIVVIAHRLSTIRNADNIIVLDEGRIAETGSWDELVGRNGRFRAMLDDDEVQSLFNGRKEEGI